MRGILGRCCAMFDWNRERGAAIRNLGLGSAFTLVVIAVVIAGLRIDAEWRIGHVELIIEGEPVVAQVLAEGSDIALGEPFDVVSRAVLALADGEYQLRVNGKGRVGRTYRFAVNRGETQLHRISLDEGRLLCGEPGRPDSGAQGEPNLPIRFAPRIEALELVPGRADLIEWSKESLICRDGATGKVRWDALQPAAPFEIEHDQRSWLANGVLDSGAGWLLAPAFDLDGDGTRDLLWYVRGLRALVALSGRDGAMLWNYVAEVDGPGGPRSDSAAARSKGQSSRMSAIAGQPRVSDVDHDGTPDLVATVVFAESMEERTRRTAVPGSDRTFLQKRALVAVSGRSGVPIWRHALDQQFAARLTERETQLTVMASGRGRDWIGYLNGTRWSGLEPATGRVQGEPIELGFVPRGPLQHGDLDGDGEPEIVALGPGSSADFSTLHAYSVKTRRELWAVEVSAGCDDDQNVFPRGLQPFWDDRASAPLLLVADLDGDGRSEIVAGDAGKLSSRLQYRGVCLIDGPGGAVRWRRPMRPENSVGDGLAALIEAPDLDGDGTRDLVAVSRYAGRHPFASPKSDREEPERVYVDALSGKSGRALWWWHTDLAEEKLTWIWAPRWWGRGPDGWPMLALGLGGAIEERSARSGEDEDDAPGIVHLLEASTGRERHRVMGLSHGRCHDLDGDGLLDLWGEVDGELRAFRGEAPEVWRALGRFEPAGAAGRKEGARAGAGVDFDGDGIADTLIADLGVVGGSSARPRGSRSAMARSGRDGHLIWKNLVDARGRWFDPTSRDEYELSAFAVPEGDLDGDGTADVIVRKRPARAWFPESSRVAATIELLSGSSGTRLWTVSLVPNGAADSLSDWLEACMIEPNGAPDLIVQIDKGESVRLVRVSGRSGRILWDVDISGERQVNVQPVNLPHVLADLDGDGGLDVLTVLPHSDPSEFTGYNLAAVSLRDGKRLWSRVVTLRGEFERLGDLQVGDIDGDRRCDVVVLEVSGGERGKVDAGVRAFDGRDGTPRWTWKPGMVRSIARDRQVITLADFEGRSIQSVCVACVAAAPGGLQRWIIVLDRDGNARRERQVALSDKSLFSAVDLNGDGKDELVGVVVESDSADGRVCAWDRDLKELWAWPPRMEAGAGPSFVFEDVDPQRAGSRTIERILPASSGRAGRVMITPGLAIDGATGRALWTGQAALVSSEEPDGRETDFAPKLLDAGDSTGNPLLIALGPGATVVRAAMPTDEEGIIAAARGRVWVAAGGLEDPRWLRPLPWKRSLQGFFGPTALLTASGLALVNLVLPLLGLWIVVGRRRVFRVWALMIVPVVAVVPLMVYLGVAPWLPVGEERWLATEWRVFLVGTLAGLPVVLAGWWVIAAVVRGKWRRVLAMVGLVVVATMLVAGGWIGMDRKAMAGIEYYGAEGWGLVVMAGAYLAAVIWGVGRALLGGYGWVRRRGLSR